MPSLNTKADFSGEDITSSSTEIYDDTRYTRHTPLTVEVASNTVPLSARLSSYVKKAGTIHTSHSLESDPGHQPALLLDTQPSAVPSERDTSSNLPISYPKRMKQRSLYIQPRFTLAQRDTCATHEETENKQSMQPQSLLHSSGRLNALRRSLSRDGITTSESLGEPPQVRDAITRAETLFMLSACPGEAMEQQQDVFMNDWIADISRLDTLQLASIQVAHNTDTSPVNRRQGTTSTGVPLLPAQPVQLPLPVIATPAETAQETAAQEEKRKAVASTAGGAAIAGLGDLASAILRYATTVLMTNLFAHNINIYGEFVETNTIVTVLGYASKLGFDSATLRFLSTYRAQGQRGKAAALIRFASLIALISGSIWGVLFFVSAFVLSHVVFKKNDFDVPFKEATLLVPLIGIQLVTSATLQAFKAIKWKVYVDRLIQPGVTLLLVVAFYALGMRLEALILATTCGYLASVITGQFLVGKATQKMVRGVTPEYDVKTWLTFALPMFFNSMIRNILNSTDVLFLGVIATETQLAFYGAADRVSYFVVAPLIALNAIFSPLIAEYHARGEHKQLEMMFKLVTKWSISLSFPVFLACVVFRDPILGIFTQKYTAAGLVLVVLSFGNFVDAGVGSVNYLLTMTGRPRIILANTVATVVVNILLALMLVPRFNILGAALAAALTVIILNIVGLIEVYVVMKIHPYRWDTLKPLVAGCVAAAVGSVLTHFLHAGYGHRAIPLVILVFLLPFILVYIAVLALLRFDEEDRMVFDTVRAKFAKGKSNAQK